MHGREDHDNLRDLRQLRPNARGERHRRFVRPHEKEPLFGRKDLRSVGRQTSLVRRRVQIRRVQNRRYGCVRADTGVSVVYYVFTVLHVDRRIVRQERLRVRFHRQRKRQNRGTHALSRLRQKHRYSRYDRRVQSRENPPRSVLRRARSSQRHDRGQPDTGGGRVRKLHFAPYRRPRQNHRASRRGVQGLRVADRNKIGLRR